MSTKPWLTEEYHGYLRSDRWILVRLGALIRAGYCCQRCGTSRGLQVHHVRYDRFGGDEEPDDLEVLCFKCHESEHSSISASHLYAARLDGWAARRYGDDPGLWPEDIEDRFDDLLDRVDPYD